jgi:hypothetical protein
MNITGEFNYNFYPQKEINWSKILTPYKIDGEYKFLFSGASGNDLIFKLKNNKIFSYNEDLLGGFRNNEILNFSGNVSTNSIDLYYNNTPLYLGLNRNGSGQIVGFNISLTGNSNVDFRSLNLFGEKPEVLFDTNLLVSSTGIQFPINIFNKGSDNIVIYSGVSLNTDFSVSGSTNLSISPNSSSQIFLISERDLSAELQIININLFTNFGTQDLFINLSGIEILPSLFTISISPPETLIFNNSNLLYTLNLSNSSGSNIEISLEHSSGITGDYFKNILQTGFLNNIPISGFISGSGFINEIKTGLISGFNILRNNFEFGTGSGIITTFKIADDRNISILYSAIVTGRGNIDFIRDVVVSGTGNLIYSGFVNYAGGILTGNTFGFASGLNFGQTETGNISGSSSLFQRWTGGISANFLPEDYQLINFVSPRRFVTGNFSTGLSLFGLAFATGEKATGKLLGDFGANDFEPGIYTFSKPFSGPVTGTILEYTGFDPIEVTTRTTQTTGLLNTILYKTVIAQGCEIDFGDLGESLPASGFPDIISRIGAKGTGSTIPVEIFSLLPLNPYIEWQFENSNQLLNSGSGYIAKQVKFFYKTGDLKSGDIKFYQNTGASLSNIAVDKINDNIYITRGNQTTNPAFIRSIYNPFYQTGWNDNNWSNNDLRFLNTPAFTLWNKDGWNTQTGIDRRNYTGFHYLFSDINVFPETGALYTVQTATRFRNAITGKQLVMWDFLNDKYYAVTFSSWGGSPTLANANTVAYVRREITGDKVATLQDFKYKYNIRTNISRLGSTISGTGYFDNLFQSPFFTGGSLSGFINNSGNIINFNGIDISGFENTKPNEKFSIDLATWGKDFYGWKESISSLSDTVQLNGRPNVLSSIYGDFDLHGESDKSIIDFELTGSVYDTFPSIGFGFQTQDTGRLILANLYEKNYISGRSFSAKKIFTGSGFIPFDNKIFSGTGFFNVSTDFLFRNTGDDPFKIDNAEILNGDIGSNVVLGAYILKGVYNNKPYYILANDSYPLDGSLPPSPNNPLFNAISWNSTGWILYYQAQPYYFNQSNTPFPWLGNWSTGNSLFFVGAEPPPIVNANNYVIPFPDIRFVSGNFRQTGSIFSGSFIDAKSRLFTSPKDATIILSSTGKIQTVEIGVAEPYPNINFVSGNFLQTGSRISGNFSSTLITTFGLQGGGTAEKKNVVLFNSPKDGQIILTQLTGSLRLGIVTPFPDESLDTISGNLNQIGSNNIISGNFRFSGVNFRSPTSGIVTLLSTGNIVTPEDEFLISGNLNQRGRFASGRFIDLNGNRINSNLNSLTGVYINNTGISTTRLLNIASGGFFWADNNRNKFIGSDIVSILGNNLRTGNYFWEISYKDLSPQLITPNVGFTFNNYIVC